MKKIFLSLFIYSFCILHFAFSQNPLVKQWDYRYGGADGDFLYSIKQASDNGFILGGVTWSNTGGDKTQDSWGYNDFWVVKINSLGNKQWDKDFGGTLDDNLLTLQETIDRGFILGGHSRSGISGDKSQNTQGEADYWIIKIDSVGNKLWDKDFGGLQDDLLMSITQTDDGGFILGGYSISDSSGDKTQNTRGDYDYWIVKIDSLGNKEWDKDFGGNSFEVFYSIQQTYDGGYILGGISLSNAGGDKSQDSWGTYDYWIIKTDSLGNKLWDRDFGGTDMDLTCSVQETHDGFILGGNSYSGIGGDKSQDTWGLADYWIIKIDSLGNKQWDKSIGGTGDEDDFGNITVISSGGFIIAGTSYSNISGNKTESNIFGSEQTWVMKIDSLGNILWDKTVHTSGHDEVGLAMQLNDGCYIMANNTDAGIAGYKTQSAWNNSSDYWIIKFCETLQSGFLAPTFLCPGTCVSFVNLSSGALNYQWSFPGANPDTSTEMYPANICYYSTGSYDVQLIASNSNSSDTLLLANYITVYPSPAPQAIMQIGDTLFANAGSAGYQWYFNGGLINGATDYFFVAAQSGDYNVVATDSNGCEVEAVINNVIASSQFAVPGSPFAIYPNPVSDELTIQNLGVTSESTHEISIYNVLGENIYTDTDAHSERLTVNCEHLVPGLYILEVSNGNRIYRTKFMKQ